MLVGRRTGPVFLTERKAKPSVALVDVDPTTGRARLSYRRAAELFDERTAEAEGGPFTLHQLRHSALTHAERRGVASDASFPGMREDGAVRDPGPCSPTAARRAWRETAGQHDRVRTGLQQTPRCDISFCDVT